MSDLRFDPVSGQWALIAPHRDLRPVELLPLEEVRKRRSCPFCAGNESETPTALTLYDIHGQAMPVDRAQENLDLDWVSRVVPNKYASFGAVTEPTCSTSSTHHQCGPFQQSTQPGPQELIIPSPRHISSLSDLNEAETSVMWYAAQQRIAAMQSLEVVQHAMLFMNCGSQAGASLEHIHVQLIGSPIVTDYLAGRVARNRDCLERENQTLVNSILDWELKKECRIVKRTENFTVLCPFASRFAFQVWIVPNSASVSFIDIETDIRDELGTLSQTIVGRLKNYLNGFSYNMLLQIAPFADFKDDHWYVEILPRTTRSAGFELGTDLWVNPMPPELAAERLR